MQHGMNALMFAAKQGHVEVFKTLLWNGKANLNLQEKVYIEYLLWLAYQYHSAHACV